VRGRVALGFWTLAICVLFRCGCESTAFLQPGFASERLQRAVQDSRHCTDPQHSLHGIDEKEVGRRQLMTNTAAVGLLLAPWPASALADDERRANAIFEAASPSVVSIGKVPPAGSDDQRAGSVAGSGFIWDNTHIVTNFHVIKDMERPFITFLKKVGQGQRSEKRITLESQIVGVDVVTDIAVLRVQEPQSPKMLQEAGLRFQQLMQPLPRSTVAERVMVGQDVFALGNPFGLEHSLSRGIVSGVARTMEGGAGRPINGVIQTDASINPGNSGGPLLNSDGKVIGVNTAILTGSGTFAGVGLAVPITTAEENVGMIISKGFVRRPFLGCIFAPDQMTLELGLRGPMVFKVEEGGPADRAGVRAMRGGRLGDLVIAVDGEKVSSSADIFKILEKRKPGDRLDVTVERAAADPTSDKVEKIDVRIELGGTDPVSAVVAAMLSGE